MRLTCRELCTKRHVVLVAVVIVNVNIVIQLRLPDTYPAIRFHHP